MDDEKTVYARRADFGARILVVDDDAITRRTLRALLERSYYRVETVSGGAEALERLADYRPELVLLDILMPGMDGLETCRRMRTLPGGDLLPIIFLTADERAETHSEAFQVKGDDFLRKPVLPTELIVRIRSLMRLKRLQAEIHAERDALLDSQKQKEQLFQFIVHDLKNPLTTIQLGLDLLSEHDDHALSAQPQFLRIRETAQGMGRMIQDILDIGRAEQMGLEPHRTKVRLRDWLPELLRQVEYRAQRLNQTLSWDCAEDITLDVDQDLVGRVVLNLLDNAMKYSTAGDRTHLEAFLTTQGVTLRVLDQGQGIPMHMRQAVFDKFMRLEEEGVTTRSSSGLGLTFCQVAVEAHGGRIWVEENQPKGSIFVVELPWFDRTRTPVFA
jgi:two-component system, sensor histidine kinase and response regulator